MSRLPRKEVGGVRERISSWESPRKWGRGRLCLLGFCRWESALCDAGWPYDCALFVSYTFSSWCISLFLPPRALQRRLKAACHDLPSLFLLRPFPNHVNRQMDAASFSFYNGIRRYGQVRAQAGGAPYRHTTKAGVKGSRRFVGFRLVLVVVSMYLNLIYIMLVFSLSLIHFSNRL
jgi:hypothetical protein